jgi:hypothetical protein
MNGDCDGLQHQREGGDAGVNWWGESEAGNVQQLVITLVRRLLSHKRAEW